VFQKCYNWYVSAEIEQDSDGMDEQCRWCGEGGNLICCDFCNNAFCKACIKRNLGRKEMTSILDAGKRGKT
jgi:transcriptional regulator ATRX